jgi:hypothetical protein
MCPFCIPNLETTSQHKIWHKAIDYQMKDMVLVEKSIESHDMEYLEQNGYIKSTEIGQEYIVIVPNECTHIITQYGQRADLYCINPRIHHKCLYD